MRRDEARRWRHLYRRRRLLQLLLLLGAGLLLVVQDGLRLRGEAQAQLLTRLGGGVRRIRGEDDVEELRSRDVVSEDES